MSEIKLLIVDDERDLLTGLQRTINKSLPEIDIVLSSNAEEALQRIQEESFDLALLDIKMPGMSGLELLKELHSADPWMTVIMMTGHGTIETAVEAIRAGAYDFITKPFDKELLLQAINKGLERNRLIRENYTLRQQVQEVGGDGDMAKGGAQ